MPISREEYAQRLYQVRARMAEEDLAALLVTDPANIYYLTGYNAWSFYTPQVLFVPASGEMVFYARAMDAFGAFRTSWLPEENIVGYPEHYVHHGEIHPFDWVAGNIREHGLVSSAAGGRVGLELDSHFFSPRAYLALVRGLPEWEFCDSHELINWVRLIKSPAEIDLMRAASRVCTEAMNAAIEHVRIGARQCDVAAEISRAQTAGTAEFGGDYPAIVPMMPTGKEADTPHLTWNDQPFEEGQAVIVELSGAYRRYHTPLARTIMLGKPSKKLRKVAGAVADGLEAVLELVRPGTLVTELSEIWDITLAKQGYQKESRLGYSIGIGYPPDWGERTVSLRVGEQTVLEENMTFHLMCGMWMDNYGYEVSEPFRVSADGVETFTDFPRELIQKGNL